MFQYITFLNDYINIPANLIVVVVVLLFGMQIGGEIIEFFGKTAPGFMKIRKIWQNRKNEKAELIKTLKEATEVLKRDEVLFKEIQSHYSQDNIAKRDGWMQSVNDGLAESKDHWKELSEKLDKNNADTLELKIESMRSAILNLAQRAIDPNVPLTHEEFRRVFRIHSSYQKIIEEEKLENGEVDVAIRVIEEGYRERLKTHGFVENVRGYEQK